MQLLYLDLYLTIIESAILGSLLRSSAITGPIFSVSGNCLSSIFSSRSSSFFGFR